MPETGVLYLGRSFWTDREAGGHLLPSDQIRRMMVHHTVMGRPIHTLEDVRNYMVRLAEARPDLKWNGLPEVPYSFVVLKGFTPDQGIVVEGRGWDRTGAHTANWNSKVYGVAYAGNADVDEITPGVIEGFREIGRRLQARLNGIDVGPTWGHRDTKATACPGANLYAVLGQLQPPFPALVSAADLPTEDEMPDTLEFVKREDSNPAVYMVIGGRYKVWVPDMATLNRWAERHRISTNVRLDTALVNSCETIGEEP